MASREKLLATATEYMQAHERKDIAGFMSMCTPDCRHQHSPATIAMPEMDNAQFEAMHKSVLTQFKTFTAQILDSAVDTTARKVVLFMKALGDTALGTYENEDIITLTMTPDGDKIQHEQIFFDSHAMIEWMKKMPLPESS